MTAPESGQQRPIFRPTIPLKGIRPINVLQLEEILDRVYFGSVVVDEQGIITFLSQPYADFLGIKREDAISRHVTDVIENTRMHIVVKTGEVEIGKQRIGGQDLVVQRVPIRDETGRIVGAFGQVMFEVQELQDLVSRLNILESKVAYYEEQLDSLRASRYTFEHIIGESTTLKEAKRLASKAATSTSPVQAEAFERKLIENREDVEIIERLWPKVGETDFTSYIAAITAAKPDAVYSNLFGADLVEFTRQAKGLDLFNNLVFAALYDVETLQALGKDVVEGVIGYDRGPFHIIRKLAPSERFEEFIRKYGAATNKYPSTWAINAYDAVTLWAKAVKRTNTFDTETVVDALEGLDMDSLRGPGRFIRRADHQANVGSYIGVVAWDPSFPDFAV